MFRCKKNDREKCSVHGTLPVRIPFLVKYGARKSLFSTIPLCPSYIPLYTCTLTHSLEKEPPVSSSFDVVKI